MPTTGSRGELGIVGSTGTTVLLLVGALVALGVAMIVVTVWLVRSTRSDHAALGPLEVMGDRSFRRADESSRGTRLTSARPDGAPDPAPIVPLEDVADGEHHAPIDPGPESGRDPYPGGISSTSRDDSRPDTDPAQMEGRTDEADETVDRVEDEAR